MKIPFTIIEAVLRLVCCEVSPMKLILLLIGFLVAAGCAKSDDRDPSLQPAPIGAAATTITTNLFQKLDGCYKLISPRKDGVQYLVEIKSESDPCSGATAGLTRVIITSYKDGFKLGTSGIDTYISPQGRFTETDKDLIYEYQGPSSRYCTLERNMIQVELVAVKKRDENNLEVNWSNMHCPQTVGYDKCLSLAPPPYQYLFAKSDNCLPQ